MHLASCISNHVLLSCSRNQRYILKYSEPIPPRVTQKKINYQTSKKREPLSPSFTIFINEIATPFGIAMTLNLGMIIYDTIHYVVALSFWD